MATIKQKKLPVSDLIKENLSFEILTAPHSHLGGKKLARQSLKKILAFDDKKELIFSDFNTLKDDSSCYISLSHTTPPWGYPLCDIAASATVSRTLAQGVGIDLEWAFRPMAPKAHKYFQNKKDQKIQPFFIWSGEKKNMLDNRLLLWSQKEAAFKSLRLWQKKIEEQKAQALLLKDIWINGPYFGLTIGTQQVLGRVYSFEYFFYDSIIVSLAYLYKESLLAKKHFKVL